MQGSGKARKGRKGIGASPVALMSQAVGTALPYGWLVESSARFWAPSCPTCCMAAQKWRWR